MILNPYFRLFGLLCLSLIVTNTWSKSFSSLKKVEQASEQFMTQVSAGDPGSAYSIMSAYAGINVNAFIERGEKVSQDLAKLEKSAGKPISFAKLKTESVDDHFFKVTYLLKYQTAAIVWELNFYQPDNGWVLVDISYHADINRLFK